MVIKLFFIPIEMYLGAALDLVPLNQIHKFASKVPNESNRIEF